MKNSFHQLNSELISIKQIIAKTAKRLTSEQIKNYLLLRDVINPYYGKTFDLSDPLEFNCTHLVELTIRGLNKDMKPSDGYHSDDIYNGLKSDTKTSSFNINPTKGTNVSHVGSITGVRSPRGILKDGSLRVVITDPFLWKCHYFYIPQNVWSTWKLSGPKKGADGEIRQGSISYAYNSQTGLIVKLEPYRVGSPIELANRND